MSTPTTLPASEPRIRSLPVQSPPTHDEISACARELWIQHGRPSHLDQAIWLDAETLLLSGGTRPSANYRELRRHG